MVVRVRLATPSDGAGIAAVHVQSWQRGYRGLIDDAVLDRRSIAERGRRWTAILRNTDPRVTTLVAEVADGSLAGFCSGIASARAADVAEDAAEISLLYVAPAHQRKDIGRTLLATALEQLRGDGAGAVIVWVLAGNPAALRCYAAAGFVPTELPRPSRSDRRASRRAGASPAAPQSTSRLSGEARFRGLGG